MKNLLQKKVAVLSLAMEQVKNCFYLFDSIFYGTIVEYLSCGERVGVHSFELYWIPTDFNVKLGSLRIILEFIFAMQAKACGQELQELRSKCGEVLIQST